MEMTSYYSKYGVRHNYTWRTQAKWRTLRVVSLKKEKEQKRGAQGPWLELFVTLLSMRFWGFLAQQDEQHSDQVSWQWWGLISQSKIKLKSTSPRNGINDTITAKPSLTRTKSTLALRLFVCTVRRCQLCKHIAKTGKDVIEKFILTLQPTLTVVWAWSIVVQNMIAYLTLGNHIRQWYFAKHVTINF